MDFTEKIEALKKRFIWSTSRRREFYLMLAGFISDGKPVFDSLKVLEERWVAKKDGRAEVVTMMMAQMRGRNRQGKALRLGEAMALWAPNIEAMAIDAGEQSGDVANGLRMAADLTETQSKINSTLWGELAYPMFLLLMLFGLLFMLKSAVIPVFDQISSRALWPTSARVLGWIADHANWIVFSLIGFLAVVSVVFSQTKGKWIGEVRQKFDIFIPPWNIYRKSTSSIMMACFSAFIRAGVPFSAIIDRLSKTASDWEKYHLDMIRSRMRKGMPDADAMAVDLFDEDTRWKIGVYGGMSNFAQALESLSKQTISVTIDSIKKTAGIARFLVMVSVAGMIIWIYGTFFTIVMSAKGSGM